MYVRVWPPESGDTNLYLPGQNSSEMGHEAGWKTGNLRSSRVSHGMITMRILDRRVARTRKTRVLYSQYLGLKGGRGREEGRRFTFRNSLSSRGGYRGGCGVKDGEDLERRTPNLLRRLLLPCVVPGCV